MAQAELERAKLYSRPRLALDCVGGASAQRLADALGEGGQLVVYGAMSGKSPQFSWHQWVFQGVQVGYGGWAGLAEGCALQEQQDGCGRGRCCPPALQAAAARRQLLCALRCLLPTT